jgi:hypothetical protein
MGTNTKQYYDTHCDELKSRLMNCGQAPLSGDVFVSLPRTNASAINWFPVAILLPKSKKVKIGATITLHSDVYVSTLSPHYVLHVQLNDEKKTNDQNFLFGIASIVEKILKTKLFVQR